MTPRSKRAKPVTMTEAAAAAPEEADKQPAAMPAMVAIDQPGTELVKQAVVDSLSQLPPAARHAASEYFRGILPRIVVIAAV